MSKVNPDTFFTTGVMPPAVIGQRGKSRLKDYQSQRPGMVVEFGFPELDDKMSMLKGCFYLLAARPGVGKTALAMQIMERTARTHKLPIVFFSAEMDAATIALREATARTKVSYWDVVKGKATPAQYGLVESQLGEWQGMGIHLDESSSPTLEYMAEQLSFVQAAYGGLGLVVFDYLELAGGFEGEQNQKVTKVAKGLKAIAKKFDTPVLALMQMNRASDDHATPTLADLMYGGEREADGVLVLKKRMSDNGKVLIDMHVVKHRHGPTGMATVGFTGDTMRFVQVVVKRTELESNEGDSLGAIRQRLEGTGRLAAD